MSGVRPGGERKAEPNKTFLIPSTVQKRPMAKGRSMETHTTVTSSSLAASSLKRRTEAAQTGVSRLGKTLSTRRLPAKSVQSTWLRSGPERWKHGAVSPMPGTVPQVWQGVPLKNTVSIYTGVLFV